MIEILGAIKCEIKTSISEWADENRVLSSEDSAAPGKWRTNDAEYQRGIMDAITNQDVEKVVLMKGTQVGYTAILGNVIGFYAQNEPSSMLMIQPTIEMAEAWSKERFAPMIKDTPIVRSLFKEAKSRSGDNTLRLKKFAGGFIAIVGANAPAGLASRPIRIVLADEVDRWPVSAGTEGDPLTLAAERQTTFWNRKTIIGSTPVIKNESVIEREYEASDKRKYYVPCPQCKKMQVLKWSQVKWEKELDSNKQTKEHFPETAAYQCEHCNYLWSDIERNEAVRIAPTLKGGGWRATAAFNGVAGFHLPKLYSPWVKLSKVVGDFLKARKDPQLLKVWTNTVLAETYEEQGERADSAGLAQHIEQYGSDDLPEGAWYATMGVDVQGDRLEAEILAWGKDDETWGIKYEVIYGDPASKETWSRLEEIRKTKFWTVSGRLVRIRSVCIDTGGHHAASVIAYCDSHSPNDNVYAIKGASGTRPIWPKRASKTKDNKNVWVIGVDAAKESIYARFKFTLPEGVMNAPGYCHLSPDYDDAWFDQVTSEYVVTRYKEGRPYRVWVLPGGKRNEALDCRVYCYAAKNSLRPEQMNPSSVKIDKSVVQVAETDESKVAPHYIISQRRNVRRQRSMGVT